MAPNTDEISCIVITTPKTVPTRAEFPTVEKIRASTDRPGDDVASALQPSTSTGLTAAVHDGDVERLVRDHRRAVQTYALSMASTPNLAEDAVQNTFLRAWRYLDSFRGNDSF